MQSISGLEQVLLLFRFGKSAAETSSSVLIGGLVVPHGSYRARGNFPERPELNGEGKIRRRSQIIGCGFRCVCSVWAVPGEPSPDYPTNDTHPW